MSRYIDLDKVIDKIEDEWGYEGIREDLYDIPTADVEEVRHGENIYYTKNDEHCEFKCSVCNAWIGVVEGGTDALDAARGFKYCPACGAKLDKETEE